jgi:mannose-6-phosphate isomerase-like protein (cupin superfamily)
MNKILILCVFILIFFCTADTCQAAEKPMQEKKDLQSASFLIETDSEVAVSEPGPHEGGGQTTGHAFFTDVPGLKIVFKKRVLHPGSGIGYHEQKDDEIYYIISGSGELTMNGINSIVKAGMAILTRTGASHSLRQIGAEDLVIFIVYPNE